mmetsp:Transcript_297/g.561  ORF Transcript_297/g.561 Transcript_297/m.561 type:complete len:884 (+) Transcript_297:114-2765(+)
MLAFRVYSAATGDSFTVRMDTENFKIAVFKSSLATFSGIAPNDQILLIGPPFKVLDSHFGPDMCSGGQKIFMFDKRIMSDASGIEPAPVKLKPYMIPPPVTTDVPMSISLAESSSPMLRIVPDYESQFLSHIRRGESFLSAVEQASASCKRCLEQIEVQQQSLESAVSNLNDHYTTTKVSFESKQHKIIEQQRSHKNLLDTFEDYFQQLGEITLHPALQTLLSNYSNLSESGESGNSKSNSLVTLRDTIPIDKELAWRDKCLASHVKVEENMTQLQIIFDKIAGSMSKIGVANELPYTLQQLIEYNTAMESNVEFQRSHMDDLRESYRSAIEEISALMQCEGTAREAKTAELFSLLETSRKSQEQVIQPMEERCTEAIGVKDMFAETKTVMTRNIYHTLRGIAAVQTDIQFKLKKGMELMTRWRQGHNGYFQHLERIRSLPEAYATFLCEMTRRAKYTEEFELLVKTSVDSISAFRSKETEQREKFMADKGSCLPPVFFDMVPSLIEKPPFFNASSTDRQQIPDIPLDDVRDLLEKFSLEVNYNNLSDKADDTNVGDPKTPTNRTNSNNDNNDSGATLTSSSSGSAATPRNTISSVHDVETKGEVENSGSKHRSQGDDVVVKKYLQMEEKLKRLEEENSQLRQMLTTNIRPLLTNTFEEEKEPLELINSEDENVDTDLVDKASSAPVVSPEADKLHSFLNMELSTMLIDVLELKDCVGNCLPFVALPSNEVTQHQLSEVAGTIQSIHALATSVKDDVSKMKLARAEGGTLKPGESPVSKISFLQLNVGDVALFLPTNKKDTYLAFTSYDMPHYYLSQDSLATIKEKNGGQAPNYILGEIIFINERIASKDSPSNVGSWQAPKSLPPGLKYHLLEIDPLDFSAR